MKFDVMVNENETEMLYNAIREYLMREFHTDEPDMEDFPRKIGIAYCEYEGKTLYSEQWCADIIGLKAYLFIDDRIKAEEIKFNDAEEMTEWFKYTTFDELVGIADNWIEEHIGG